MMRLDPVTGNLIVSGEEDIATMAALVIHAGNTFATTHAPTTPAEAQAVDEMMTFVGRVRRVITIGSLGGPV